MLHFFALTFHYVVDFWGLKKNDMWILDSIQFIIAIPSLTWLTWLMASGVLELQWPSTVSCLSWLSQLRSSPGNASLECLGMWVLVCQVFFSHVSGTNLSVLKQELPWLCSSGQQNGSSSLWFLRELWDVSIQLFVEFMFTPVYV